jgi:cold shock CspA family protein
MVNMIIPVQITFRNVASTPEVEEKIRVLAQKLEKFYSPITSCRVLVEASARHRKKGYPFHVRLDLTLPEGEIVVRREPTLHATEQDMGDERRRKQMETRPERKHLEVALREAFHAARRRLEDHARRRRADVKTHEPVPQARVTRLFPVEGYGYVETPDGREIYFHANSVLNNRFKSLRLGSKVALTEEPGENGPQASTVHLITKGRVPAAAPPAVRRRPNRKIA